MGKLLHKGIDYTGVSPYKFVPITEDDYNALTPTEQEDETKMYWLYDVDTVSADIDDESVSSGKVWSSEKVSSEISDVQDQVDTNTDDISTLNSAIADIVKVVSYQIPNDTTVHTYNYPTGHTNLNCFLVGAYCHTRFGTIVDPTYGEKDFWGNIAFALNNFEFEPKVAGNCTSIDFVFVCTD